MATFNNYKGFGPASAEYWEGRRAYCAGLTPEHNPYEEGTSQWHDWREGYFDELKRRIRED